MIVMSYLMGLLVQRSPLSIQHPLHEPCVRVVFMRKGKLQNQRQTNQKSVENSSRISPQSSDWLGKDLRLRAHHWERLGRLNYCRRLCIKRSVCVWEWSRKSELHLRGKIYIVLSIMKLIHNFVVISPFLKMYLLHLTRSGQPYKLLWTQNITG